MSAVARGCFLVVVKPSSPVAGTAPEGADGGVVAPQAAVGVQDPDRVALVVGLQVHSDALAITSGAALGNTGFIAKAISPARLRKPTVSNGWQKNQPGVRDSYCGRSRPLC